MFRRRAGFPLAFNAEKSGPSAMAKTGVAVLLLVLVVLPVEEASASLLRYLAIDTERSFLGDVEGREWRGLSAVDAAQRNIGYGEHEREC